MNSSRLKKVLLLLGILIAVLIGINTYAGAIAQSEPIFGGTISLVEKIKSVTDIDLLIQIIKI